MTIDEGLAQVLTARNYVQTVQLERSVIYRNGHLDDIDEHANIWLKEVKSIKDFRKRVEALTQDLPDAHLKKEAFGDGSDILLKSDGITVWIPVDVKDKDLMGFLGQVFDCEMKLHEETVTYRNKSVVCAREG